MIKEFFVQSISLLKLIYRFHTEIIVLFQREKTELPTPLLKVIKPNTFEEALWSFYLIRNKIPEYAKTNKKAKTENELVIEAYPGFGMALRNEWGLWDFNCKLTKDLAKRFNLFHADDMSALLMKCAWQELQGKPVTPHIFAMSSILYWRKMKQTGEWDGMVNGCMINLDIPLHVKKGIEKEKKLLGL